MNIGKSMGNGFLFGVIGTAILYGGYKLYDYIYHKGYRQAISDYDDLIINEMNKQQDDKIVYADFREVV